MLPCLWAWWFIFVEDRTFSCNATCNLWNLAPCVRMCRWNFHTNTSKEPGNWAAGNSVGSRWDGLHVLSYPQVVETWPISEKNPVFWVSPPIPRCGSSVESSLSRTQTLPFLHLSANTFVCALLIVNLFWEQRTFTHRTSTISGAAKSCWYIIDFSSKTSGRRGSCLLVITPLAMPGVKKEISWRALLRAYHETILPPQMFGFSPWW